MRDEHTTSMSRQWTLALACFVLAGLTGTLFRFGQALGGLPGELSFENVRRAHSHLMFFSWVTPALMALIATRLARHTGRAGDRRWRWVIAANLVLGLASFVPFLLDGYQPTAIFGLDLPLSIIFSTASMFAWYAFIWLYWRDTRAVRRTTALALWDVAMVALAVSSVGAWARGALIGMKVDDLFLTSGSVHFFLNLFSDGWLGLAALGLVHDLSGVEMGGRRKWWTTMMVVGLPVTFLLAMPMEVVPPAFRTLAGVGGFLTGVGFAAHAVIIWRESRLPRILWAIPLGALAAKAAAQMLFILPGIAGWGEAAGLRVLYLHVLLLAFVSLVLIEGARLSWKQLSGADSRLMQAAVLALLITILPTTGLWPAVWKGPSSLMVTAVGTLPPIAVALWLLIRPPRRQTTAYRAPDGRATTS